MLSNFLPRPLAITEQGLLLLLTISKNIINLFTYLYFIIFFWTEGISRIITGTIKTVLFLKTFSFDWKGLLFLVNCSSSWNNFALTDGDPDSFIPSVLDSFFVFKAKESLCSCKRKARGEVLCKWIRKPVWLTLFQDVLLLAYEKGIDLDEDPQVESGGAMLAIVVLHQ